MKLTCNPGKKQKHPKTLHCTRKFQVLLESPVQPRKPEHYPYICSAKESFMTSMTLIHRNFQGYDVVLTATQEPFYGKITCVDSKFIPPVQCQKGTDAPSLKLNENSYECTVKR